MHFLRLPPTITAAHLPLTTIEAANATASTDAAAAAVVAAGATHPCPAAIMPGTSH